MRPDHSPAPDLVAQAGRGHFSPTTMKRRKISIDNPEHSMNQYLSQNLATMQDTPGPYGGFLSFIEPGKKFITKQIRKLCKEESHPPQD